jgi:hypothetical protein
MAWTFQFFPRTAARFVAASGRSANPEEVPSMFGRVLWPALVIAFVADLVVDRVFGNTVVNLITFGVVFAAVALVRYAKRTD